MKEKLERIKQFYNEKAKQQPIQFWSFSIIVIFAFFVSVVFVFFLRAPTNFPQQSLFFLEKDLTLNQVSQKLSEEHFIRSAFWLKNAVIVLRGEEKIRTGDYFFEKPESTFEIAKRIIQGDFGLLPIRVTIHEGLNIFEISDILEKNFPKFNRGDFLELAKEKEGYLFPDTYFFTPNTKTEDFIEVMEKNFYIKIESLKTDIKKFGKPTEEIIKLASIIETEARTPESRKVISGILWRRLSIDMPLQVDVTFKYINGKNSFNLTSSDLKIDSPYNTYRYKGLPPTPIANPGIDAIKAAITPTETDFLFFLAGKNGKIHYATTFDEHKENKKNYLRN